MVKALAINGSHRKGRNTAFLLEQVGEELKASNVEVEIVDLVDYNIEWCISCNRCLGRSGCTIQDDDMSKLHEKMMDADIIILGTPTYWMNVSGRMKNFMDRTRYMHMAKNLLDGKIGAAVTLAGLRNGGQEACLNAMENYMRGQGMLTVDLRDCAQALEFNAVAGSLQKTYDENGIVWIKHVSEDAGAVEACKHLARKIVKRTKEMGKMS